MDEPNIVTRAMRFVNLTKPNSIDNRKAIQLVRELLMRINELDQRIEGMEKELTGVSRSDGKMTSREHQ